MLSVNEAYKRCRTVIEHHSKTFAKAFGHLPQEKRQAVWAVYAFCRTADDIVDEGENPASEIIRFKDQFHSFAAGHLPEENYLWIALRDTFSRFEMDFQPFYDMIEGQQMDLIKKRYETLEEVKHYSYHVASTVGLMLLPILAPEKKDRLREGAISLGIAMQLTNILRDIGEDLARDRIYFPQDVMRKHGYSEDMLWRTEINHAFSDAWEELAEDAEQFYEAGLATIGEYPVESRIPVKAAALFYREILHSVRRNSYEVFRKRAFVSKEEKTVLMKEAVKG
ncbi:phytoene/squalene synthase family protein [Alteribacter natronophilus]|uniref:phytoene/squalene synthase family protein n=1 Tax=Alteribacter natronophilus TaxID=2583810 RepID=UPI00110E1F1B|nr:phytoene/squalene synthase family protein [Alteribacter natronophilus]TMW73698.1 phytoene/squalene synthase family protein [Alteribacter natronophilus]